MQSLDAPEDQASRHHRPKQVQVHPSAWRAFLPQMEATSSRLGKGALALPFPWTPPIDQGAFEPLGTLINPARIGYHQRVDAETGQGAIVPLKPLLLSALEHVPAEVDLMYWAGLSPSTKTAQAGLYVPRGVSTLNHGGSLA